MHKITWNGIDSDSLGIRIERAPKIIRPRRKATVVSIPGRNGDIIFMEDAWENYVQPYEIFFGTGIDLSAEAAANEVSNWLNATGTGYGRLEDTYEPDIYRLAYYIEEQNIENAITEYGRETIRFNCRPERFLKTGETIVKKTSSGSTISNTTKYNSKPLIKITGSGSVTLSVGSDFKVSISSVSSYINLDCDTQDAYKTTAENQNDRVTITKGDSFPQLHPGSNTISWTGSVTQVEITPRWFTI